MPHRPTSRTPDDTAQDNGARALAEAMAYAMPDWRDRPSYVHGWMTAFRAIERILANGAAFLPDAAELDRLRRIEARYKRLQSAHHRMLRVTAVTCTACKIERAGGSARDGG